MIKLKGFVTRDDFVVPSSKVTSPIYELSSKGMTYAKVRGDHYYTVDPRYSLKVFKIEGSDFITNTQSDLVMKVITAFTSFLPTIPNVNKQNAVMLFTSNYNALNPSLPVSGFTYNNIVEHNSIQVPDYISFVTGDVSVNVWLSGSLFESFYPDYDIDVILPFENFTQTVNNPGEFINQLNNFNLIKFNDRIDSAKSQAPCTSTRILNIPYKLSNTGILKDCYFAFNVYGVQGNYEHILKLELYHYLTEELDISGSVVETLFPTLLNVNEFFFIPRWDNIAIPGSTGISSINSQVVSSYSEDFDITKFVKGYGDHVFLKNNTYTVPFDYNNLNLQVVNGMYTDSAIRDFKSYYSDFISVPTTHPDFSRMKQRTQRLVTLLESMLDVATSSDSTELFNKIQHNSSYSFSVIVRSGVTYLSYLFEDHQLYIIPRYEFLANR